MTRRTFGRFAGALGILALTALPALAQHDMHGGGMAMSYDKATETTLTGTIENIVEVPGAHAMSGTHLVLQTKDGEVHVHAGPAAFLAQKKANFKKGDQVEVTGSRIKGEGFEAVLARRIKDGGRVIVVRSEAGKPLWAGSGS